MEHGIENKLLSAGQVITFSSTVDTNPGGDADQIIDDDSLRVYEVDQGTTTLTLELGTPITAGIIALFNINFETSIQIITYSAYPATPIENKVFTAADLSGLDNPAALFVLGDKTTPIVAIDIVWAGASSSFESYAGYIWAGAAADMTCAEKIQPTDESFDEVKISRANTIDVDRQYNQQSFDVTLGKNKTFAVVRAEIRVLLSTGYATKRPWIFTEPFFPLYPQPEVVLGIMDSGKVKYDIIETSDGDLAQTTIGVLEVF